MSANPRSISTVLNVLAEPSPARTAEQPIPSMPEWLAANPHWDDEYQTANASQTTPDSVQIASDAFSFN